MSGSTSLSVSRLDMGGFNCGIKIVPGQPKSAWTCPCGLGYWDAVKSEFITGDRVRRREALNRADYEAHLRECSQCHAQAQQDGLTSVSSQEEGQETQSGARTRPSTKTSDSRISHPIPARQRQYFLPMDRIRPEVIQGSIKTYLGADASVKLSTNRDGTPGYIIHSNNPPTVEIISELMRLSLPPETAAPVASGHGQRPPLIDRTEPRYDKRGLNPYTALDPNTYPQVDRGSSQQPETRIHQQLERMSLQQSDPRSHHHQEPPSYQHQDPRSQQPPQDLGAYPHTQDSRTAYTDPRTGQTLYQPSRDPEVRPYPRDHETPSTEHWVDPTLHRTPQDPRTYPYSQEPRTTQPSVPRQDPHYNAETRPKMIQDNGGTEGDLHMIKGKVKTRPEGIDGDQSLSTFLALSGVGKLVAQPVASHVSAAQMFHPR
ncbi:hypothetical protein EPUS_08684 [Endocarpon pusillum Z07020]|uniref:Uncharacterized protein n=1 Tax=Endocarpon pusillum (strain Z07020 / HMAS-L-300199) TaxID=1263415 RepID=U1HM90_ENDPU|nr:uncharacterized protein EPUS_08684 [Endocarpon pusillum Z07020]ERF71415.1 hypothetical protein EPUS_08684 [Endocarpon pusillum Z07020]